MYESELNNKVSRKCSNLFLVFFVAATVGTIFFLITSLRLQNQVDGLKAQPRISAEASLAFLFMNDFIENVLGSDAEVDFETRLRLENEVRAIGDVGIVELWKKFVESRGEPEAQENVLKILQRLIVLIQSGSSAR